MAPTWWKSDAPHWDRRTTAITAVFTLIAAVTLGVITLRSQREPEPTSGRSAGPLQTSAPSSPSSGECSPDSESGVSSGWGPDRPLYHDDTYPAGLTFNSTSTNANIGDERNFVWVAPAGAGNVVGSGDSLEVKNGEEYTITVYARLDGPDAYEAKGTKLVVNIPTCTGHRIAVSAILSSADTYPGQVWDGAAFWSRKDFDLALVPDSGVAFSNAFPGPQGLPFSVIDLTYAKGIPLGSSKLDGIFKVGYANSVYTTLKVRAQVAP